MRFDYSPQFFIGILVQSKESEQSCMCARGIDFASVAAIFSNFCDNAGFLSFYY
jgi:hypothetical protein